MVERRSWSDMAGLRLGGDAAGLVEGEIAEGRCGTAEENGCEDPVWT